MQSFRLRLILALLAGVTVVSLASTYFEVLARKHILRHELEVRTGWLGSSLQPYMEQVMTSGTAPEIEALAAELRNHGEALGVALYDEHGKMLIANGPQDLLRGLTAVPVRNAVKHGANQSLFGQGVSGQRGHVGIMA